MKAISIKQPWASLIVHGIKPIENRTWKCPEKYIGQRVFVHASAKNAGEYEYLLNDNQKNSVMAYGWTHGLDSYKDLYINSGSIIGSAVIKDCVVNHPSIWAEKTPLYNDFCKGCHCPNYIEWDYMGKRISWRSKWMKR